MNECFPMTLTKQGREKFTQKRNNALQALKKVERAQQRAEEKAARLGKRYCVFDS
jgi:hypothetical protein